MSFDDMPELEPLVLPGGPEYAERVLAASRLVVATTRNVLDIPYGDDYWQKIDIFLPPDPTVRHLPVLLFIHGGAWCKGYKEWMGFMAPPILRFPAIFVSVSHRLAPAVKHPAPLEDCLAALSWVHANIGNWGGNPDALYIGGHSSGGHLAALTALRRDLLSARSLSADVVKGCFTVSSPFNLHLDIATGRRAEVIRQLLARESDDHDASPVDHVEGAHVPFLLCYGGRDLPEIPVHNREMMARLKDADCPAEELRLVDCDHFQTNLSCADPEGLWIRAVKVAMTGRTIRPPT